MPAAPTPAAIVLSLILTVAGEPCGTNLPRQASLRAPGTSGRAVGVICPASDGPRPTTHTDVPARLDRLPWSAFHRLVVVALGITWILDGLEVTLAGSVAAALQTSPRLHLTGEQVGLTGSAYLAGAVLGSLFFGHLTDRLGRKKLL